MFVLRRKKEIAGRKLISCDPIDPNGRIGVGLDDQIRPVLRRMGEDIIKAGKPRSMQDDHIAGAPKAKS